jgi:hypothetical protein
LIRPSAIPSAATEPSLGSIVWMAPPDRIRVPAPGAGLDIKLLPR